MVTRAGRWGIMPCRPAHALLLFRDGAVAPQARGFYNTREVNMAIEIRQVKLIFAIGTVVSLTGGPVRMTVRLESDVSGLETYAIMKLPQGDDKDGDLTHPQSVQIRTGDRVDFAITPTGRGWVFLVIMETTKLNFVTGAIYIE